MPIHHLGFKVANFPKTRDFYLAALKPLGYKVRVSFEEGKVLGLGALFCAPDFWIVDPTVHSKAEKVDETGEEQPLTKDSYPLHIAFSASNRVQVREFYEAALYVFYLHVI